MNIYVPKFTELFIFFGTKIFSLNPSGYYYFAIYWSGSPTCMAVLPLAPSRYEYYEKSLSGILHPEGSSGTQKGVLGYPLSSKV